MKTVREPARETPVAHEAGLCVVGGSCTGVFAAVRAARLGIPTALIEQNILLGGMAAAAQVNEWHSLLDAGQRDPIIGGLTVEVLDRLRSRNAVREMSSSTGSRYRFNSAELALELDALVREHGIRVFLRGSCVAALRSENRIEAAVIEDKSGRRAVRARIFIDASGDGDLLRQAGFAAWKNSSLQPVSYQMLAAGLNGTCAGLWERIRHRAPEFRYPTDNAEPWFVDYPCGADLVNVFGPRLHGVDASDADQATEAVFEGRRFQRALLEMIRTELGVPATAAALAHALGVRETWHACGLHRLREEDLLSGTGFPDAIARGTYPIDIHTPEGTVLRHLDGSEILVGRDGSVTRRRWRDGAIPGPPFYEIPFRCLVPREAENVLVAGRLLDADRGAFGGVRVMVNMNQTGEAAGVAAALALQKNLPVSAVDASLLRRTLSAGGSPVL